MKAKFTQNQIEYFKRQAKKISTASGISHSEALHGIAKREKFKNWPTLMTHAIVSSVPETVPPVPDDHNQFDDYKRTLYQFIENLSDDKIYSILRNGGSIWIDADDALNDNISVKSLVALGQAHDGLTTQYALKIDAILALNFAGLGDMFVFQGDDDENVSPNVGFGETSYSPIAGKAALLSCIQNCDGDYESFCMRLDEHSENQNPPAFRG
ncbi:MAG: hypothetical protein NVS3B3_10190 [Aquirhabdus sp.]